MEQRAVLRDQGLAGERVAARPVRRRPRTAPILEKEYGIPRRYLQPHPVARGPSSASTSSAATSASSRSSSATRRCCKQVGVAKTEPGDENNQDISSLVGKVDIRKLETFAQDDPDAYSYSGGLCLANQGLLEFVEMFKAPIKVLHPLLTATQEGNFKGTEGFGAIPFDGIVLAHSNESEWKAFRNNKNNEAFLDRIYIVKVPYCLRVSEEVKIYEKLLRNSSLAEAPCAPGTLRDDGAVRGADAPEGAGELVSIYSQDAGLRRREPEGHRPARPRRYQEYRDYAGVDEGMSGVSTRFAFKILSKVFNFDQTEVAANPVHLMYVLEQQIEREQFPAETEQKYLGLHQGATWRRATPSSSARRSRPPTSRATREYGQNIFDRYVTYADYWIQDQEYRDTDTGEVFDRARAQRRAREDREARRHRQPEGLPQRDRQLRAARARQQRRQEPGVDQLREAAHGDREEDVLEHRGAAAGDQLQRQGAAPTRRRSTRTSSTAWSQKGYTRQAGAPAVRVVPARAQELMTELTGVPAVAMLQQIIDRRLAGKNKSIGNRERFLRRYKEQIARGGASARSSGRGIRDIEQGEDITLPEARHLRAGRSATARAATARSCIRATSEYVARRPHRAAARAAAGGGSGSGRPAIGRGRGRLRLPPDQGRVHADLLRRPGAAAPDAHPARPRRPSGRATAPAIANDGTPSNLHVDALDARRDRPAHRDRRRLARRAASSSRRELAELPDGAADAADALANARSSRRRSPRCARGSTRIPFLDPIDLRYRNRVRGAGADRQGGDVLPDGRLGLDGRGAQGPGQALLHPAVPVPDAALREDRPRLHPPPHAGAGGRRGELLPRHARPAAPWSRARWS